MVKKGKQRFNLIQYCILVDALLARDNGKEINMMIRKELWLQILTHFLFFFLFFKGKHHAEIWTSRLYDLTAKYTTVLNINVPCFLFHLVPTVLPRGKINILVMNPLLFKNERIAG